MRISVLLPVYNCPRYVGGAIESILAQTFADFEFLIIDDGSTDQTPEVLKKYTDPRIRIIRHENRGLAGTLNVGIELARGKYIARQDQDDISLPERLAKQLSYMEEHPDCGLLGTWAQIVQGDRLVERFHRHPTDASELRYHLLFNNPFVHSSVILRKSVLDVARGYSTDPERQPPEDYELWSRLSRLSGVANLPQVLLHYREIPGSMSRMGPSPFRNNLVKISRENISYAAKVEFGDPQVCNIAALTHGASELVMGKPDFQRMKGVLFAAIQNVSDDKKVPVLQRDAVQRVAALRGAHLADKAGVLGLVSNQGIVRTFLKRIFRLFQALLQQSGIRETNSRSGKC